MEDDEPKYKLIIQNFNDVKELINVIIAIRELLKIYLYVPNVTNKKKVKILTKKNHVKIHIVKITKDLHKLTVLI